MPLATSLDDQANFQSLRGAAFLLLSDVGRVKGYAVTDDGGGGATSVSSNGPDLPCRIKPVAGGENVVADRIDDRTTHLIEVPPNAVITSDDDFEIDGHGLYTITAIRHVTRARLLLLEAVAKTS
jgi:hypothetical protein